MFIQVRTTAIVRFPQLVMDLVPLLSIQDYTTKIFVPQLFDNKTHFDKPLLLFVKHAAFCFHIWCYIHRGNFKHTKLSNNLHSVSYQVQCTHGPLIVCLLQCIWELTSQNKIIATWLTRKPLKWLGQNLIYVTKIKLISLSSDMSTW